MGAWNATGNQFADRRASASFASRIWTGWLRALDRGLSAYSGEQMILVQYVPRMYGWKSMNLPFCWRARLRRNVWVMFHEVAFPFLTGQPLRHKVLAIVHRLMARIVLSGANRSFTSIEPYQQMLQWLAPKARPELLRIFSNVSFSEIPSHRVPRASDSRFVIGTFSNFQPEICQLLAKALPVILENPIFHIRLVGPGENFVIEFVRRFPQFSRSHQHNGTPRCRQCWLTSRKLRCASATLSRRRVRHIYCRSRIGRTGSIDGRPFDRVHIQAERRDRLFRSRAARHPRNPGESSRRSGLTPA